MSLPHVALDVDRLKATLAHRQRKTSLFAGRPSAVLVPICAIAREPHVVLTRRAMTLSHHKGQFAFPGGRRDPEDLTIIDTALRESHEEIGIDRTHVQVAGLLDDLTTSSGYVITPVVGWIPHPYNFSSNPHEVDLIVTLPLEAFLRPQRARTLLREGIRILTMSFEVDGHFIWGATAGILRNLSAVLHDMKARSE